jgi:hypothetical protein
VLLHPQAVCQLESHAAHVSVVRSYPAVTLKLKISGFCLIFPVAEHLDGWLRSLYVRLLDPPTCASDDSFAAAEQPTLCKFMVANTASKTC